MNKHTAESIFLYCGRYLNRLKTKPALLLKQCRFLLIPSIMLFGTPLPLRGELANMKGFNFCKYEGFNYESFTIFLYAS